jgi:hypothetical protein
MTREWFFVFIYFQTILSGVIVLLSVLFFRKRFTATRLVALHFAFSLVFSLSFFIIPFRGKEINVPGSLWTICSTLVLCALFNSALNNRHRILFVTITILFLSFAIINLLYFQQLDTNSYSKSLSALLLISCCLLYFYRLLIDLPTSKLSNTPMFWFAVGVLIYNAGTLFLFAFTSYLVNVLHDDLMIYWTLHNVFNIIQHLIIIIGLVVDLRNIQSPQPVR